MVRVFPDPIGERSCVARLSDSPNPAYVFSAGADNANNDFSRGDIAANDPTTAGVYSPTSNRALVLQPTGAELDNNGFIEARIQNTSGTAANSFAINFDWAFRNSGDRADNLQLSLSTDGLTFTPYA
jgi:hypothetical protein